MASLIQTYHSNIATFVLSLHIFGYHSYHVVEEAKLTWWDANAHCQNTYNTHLVTITNSTMNANIFSDIPGVSWIGYYDAYTEDTWQWIGYNKSTFTNWYPGQPNNWEGREDCCCLWTPKPSYWGDCTCSELRYFVCADFSDYPDYVGYNPTTPATTYSTTTPTKVLSTQQTIKQLRYNAVCSNLVDNYDLQYHTSLQECISICENMGDLCSMINFYRYFKSGDDSRCYIFESMCNIVAVNHNKTDQSMLFYKVNDDDLCTNYPTDWVDNIGDDCHSYFMYDWCNNHTIKRNENDFHELMNHGLDAMDACCECGGGVHIVDDIAVSIDIDWIDYNSDILCRVTLQNKRDWNNMYLYHFCDSMQQTDCAYLLDEDFNPTHYSYSIYLCNNSSNEHNDFEFIMDQQINDDLLSHDTYVNLQWFNIDASSYSTNISIIYLNYSECIHSVLHMDSNNTFNHGMHPCYSLDPTTSDPTTATPTTSEPTTAAPTTELTNSTTVSELVPSGSLTIIKSSVLDIVDVPPSQNMFESESYGVFSVIVICVLSLCLLIAFITIAFLRRKLNAMEINNHTTEEGDNYNEQQNLDPST
eukprot:22024_1